MTPDQLALVRVAIRDWRLAELLTNATGRRDLAQTFTGEGQASLCWEYDPTGIRRVRSRHQTEVTWDAICAHGDRLPASIRAEVIAAYLAFHRGPDASARTVDALLATYRRYQAALDAAMTPPEAMYLDLLELLAVSA